MTDRTVKVILDAEIAKYFAKMKEAGKVTRDLEKAERDLKNSIDAAEDAAGRARVSEAKLAEVRNNSKATVAQLAAAEEDHNTNLRKLDAALENSTQAEKRFQEALRKSYEEQQKGGKKTRDELDRVASRANAQFDALKFTALSVGLPAAAAIGAAGTAVAIGGIATAFAGLGVYLAARNDDIANEFTRMVNNIESSFDDVGQKFEAPVSDAIDEIGHSFERVNPLIQNSMSTATAYVAPLTRGVLDLAENAMPGFAKATAAAGPPVEGLASLLSQTGSGLSDFFSELTNGSVSSAQGMSQLGGVVQLLLGRLGTLLANLSNISGGPLGDLRAMVDNVTSALIKLTQQGAAGTGFLSGFTSSASGMLAILNSVVSVLNLLPSGVTQFAGSLTSTAMVASKFGLDIGEGWRGLGDKVRAAGTDLTGTAKASAQAKSALGGLASGAVHPAALAVGILSVGLDLLGQHQREMALNAQNAANRVNTLTDALRASNGVIDESVRSSAVKTLSAYQVLDEGTRNLIQDVTHLAGPQGAQQLTDAFLGNAAAGDKLKATLQAIVRDGTDTGKAAYGSYGQALGSTEKHMTNAAKNAQDLLNIMQDNAGTFANAADAARAESAAMQGAADAHKTLSDGQRAADTTTRSLADAFGTLAKSGGDAASKANDLLLAVRLLRGETPSVEEATKGWNDAVREVESSLKGLNLKGVKDGVVDATGAIRTQTEAGSKLYDTVQKTARAWATQAQAWQDAGVPADQIQTRLSGMNDEFAKQLKAAGLTEAQISSLTQHYGMIPKDIVTQLRLEGNNDASTELSGLLGKLKEFPDSKGIQVDVMSDVARKTLLDLGYQIVQLPNGKFQVFANTDEGRKGLTDFKKTIDTTFGTVHIQAEDEPAETTVTVWQKRTNGTTGYTTLDCRVDPASGKLQYWTRQADGTHAYSTLDTRIDPATGKVQAWVRTAEGTWGWTTLDAHTAAAEAAINDAARPRSTTITVKYDVRGAPTLPRGANRADFAAGGVAVPMASGGVLGLASGQQLSPMSPIAQRVAPATWRIVGDNLRYPEYYIPANGSARSRAILAQAMADPALQSDVTSGRAWVGSMAPRIVIPMQSSGSSDVPAQVLAAFSAQLQAAVVTGFSQVTINLDPRGISTLETRGAALNSVR
ncbi:hypothetical protein ACFORO_42465 [Amycolatopsis halotolerans]|uniref:Uncharacterized protein n=1 Tax=Amycolatopsis halotolerans TaxID=330083 RepID=A0ABV7QXI3_9PSEU